MRDAPLRNEDGHRSSRPRGPTPCVDPDHSGHGDPAQRFRIMRLCRCNDCGGTGKTEAGGSVTRCSNCRGEGSSLVEIAACGTPEAVGVALVTLAREDEFDGCPVGLIDSLGEPGRRWLIRPWLPSPRNVTDAAKLMQKQRQY